MDEKTRAFIEIQYEITKSLGKDWFGENHEIKKRKSGQTLFVKILDPKIAADRILARGLFYEIRRARLADVVNVDRTRDNVVIVIHRELFGGQLREFDEQLLDAVSPKTKDAIKALLTGVDLAPRALVPEPQEDKPFSASKTIPLGKSIPVEPEASETEAKPLQPKTAAVGMVAAEPTPRKISKTVGFEEQTTKGKTQDQHEGKATVSEPDHSQLESFFQERPSRIPPPLPNTHDERVEAGIHEPPLRKDGPVKTGTQPEPKTKAHRADVPTKSPVPPAAVTGPPPQSPYEDITAQVQYSELEEIPKEPITSDVDETSFSGILDDSEEPPHPSPISDKPQLPLPVGAFVSDGVPKGKTVSTPSTDNKRPIESAGEITASVDHEAFDNAGDVGVKSAVWAMRLSHLQGRIAASIHRSRHWSVVASSAVVAFVKHTLHTRKKRLYAAIGAAVLLLVVAVLIFLDGEADPPAATNGAAQVVQDESPTAAEPDKENPKPQKPAIRARQKKRVKPKARASSKKRVKRNRKKSSISRTQKAPQKKTGAKTKNKKRERSVTQKTGRKNEKRTITEKSKIDSKAD